jgi:hypothetical protein
MLLSSNNVNNVILQTKKFNPAVFFFQTMSAFAP